jgi:putative peptidoglycan lipid II flippase
VIVVWLTLAAYSLGLAASTTTRIYQSAFYALRDTKTPARIAGLRVLAAAAAGALLMVQFEPLTVRGLAIPGGALVDVRAAGLPLGPVGLALGAAVGAWIEWALLRGGLARRIGTCGAGAGALARMFAAAVVAALLSRGLASLVAWHPLVEAAVVAAAFGIVYLGIAHALKLEEPRRVLASLSRSRAKSA